jgi:hypothetical protein
MEALNFANGFGAGDFGSVSVAIDAGATRGCGAWANDGVTATTHASTPAPVRRTRSRRRGDGVAERGVMNVGTTAPEGGVPELLCSAPFGVPSGDRLIVLAASGEVNLSAT